MVKDEVTGECYRADHLLEDVMKRLAADPKCSPEKKAEYELIAHQVCVSGCMHLWMYVCIDVCVYGYICVCVQVCLRRE